MKRPKLQKTSKRLTCRMKFKIERKVKEHHRKARREAKKKGKGPRRKDPGVPNDAPFKEAILREAELRKQRMEEQKAHQKEERRKRVDERRGLKVEGQDLKSFQKDILKKQKDFAKKEMTVDTTTKGSQRDSDISPKAYYKEFRKVVEGADVILEVLDARDPLGCRCAELEREVIASGSNKRVVLVLNKIDLIPKENVEVWLKYLRSELPTVAFKACTQTQNQNLAQNLIPVRELNKELMANSRKCLGADNLLKLLGNYRKNAGIKTSVTIGIVGYPNVGKSSIINSLKRARACNVGVTPAVTKSLHPVVIDKNIKILDCPGIVMASGSDAMKILRNCTKVENIEDPIEPVDTILRRCNKEQMVMHYNISNYESTFEFLSLLARRRGKMRKGGIPDTKKAAKFVLDDWNKGKISYYTHPPEDRSKSTHVGAEIVDKMSAEFDWAALDSDNLATLNAVKGNPSLSGGVVFESMALSVMEDEEMEESDDDLQTGKIAIQMKGKGETKVTQPVADSTKKTAIRFLPNINEFETLDSNIQTNKGLKDSLKKTKRADVLSEQLGESLLSTMDFSKGDASKDYDFASDFIMK